MKKITLVVFTVLAFCGVSAFALLAWYLALSRLGELFRVFP